MMQIGSTHSGYKILANIDDRYILAHNPAAVQPWVVWYLDYAGEPCWGSYFSDRGSAINNLISRGFDCDCIVR